MMVGKTTNTGIDNVVNFVGSQVNINGVLNTIKVLDGNNTTKLGGNLYFLSSDGIVIGSQGVVNTGSFYAIVPNKEFMDKFIDFTAAIPEFKEGSLVAPNDAWDAEGQQAAVNSIINPTTKTSYNGSGITLAENGQITINGKINVKNAIGLFAARKYDSTKNSAEQASNIVIGPNAELNVLSSDVFGSYVNISNDQVIYLMKMLLL